MNRRRTPARALLTLLLAWAVAWHGLLLPAMSDAPLFFDEAAVICHGAGGTDDGGSQPAAPLHKHCALCAVHLIALAPPAPGMVRLPLPQSSVLTATATPIRLAAARLYRPGNPRAPPALT